MSASSLDPGDLSPLHHDALHAIDGRDTAPDGLPWAPGTSLLVKVVEWASHGTFLADEGRRARAAPGRP